MEEIGPVQYLAVAFPGNKFTGNITPALVDLVESGTIRIIDLAFVGKNANGDVIAMELEELDSDSGKAFAALQAEIGDLVNEADLKQLGASLEPNSSAAILVWEDLWAKRFTNAVREAGGVLIDIQRVPHEVVQEALKWAEQKQATA
jgi:Family of unknown function (DUF6325)